MDLDPSLIDVAVFRGEHPLHRLSDVVDRIVDHPVGADLDALLLGAGTRHRVGTDVEADDDRVRGVGEHDIRLGDDIECRREVGTYRDDGGGKKGLHGAGQIVAAENGATAAQSEKDA